MNRQEKLIAEIHAEFDTAQDRLLKEAKKVLNDVNTNVIGIADRLKSIGFKNTPTAKRGAEVKEKLVKSKDEATLIEYYAQTYPFLKFLTESELERICIKYNLIYASVERYKEDVPEKNIKDIETAQRLNYNDTSKNFYEANYSFYDWFGSSKHSYVCPRDARQWKNPISVEYDDLSEVNKRLKELYNPTKICSVESVKFTKIDRSGLFIAAPKTHFNLDGLMAKGLGFFESIVTTQVKDPIVFRYVRGGVQVLTKWGLEANDPDLVVPKLN